MKTALIFFFAVLSEVIATTALKFSEGFSKLVPSLVVVVGYGLSFYLLSLSNWQSMRLARNWLLYERPPNSIRLWTMG